MSHELLKVENLQVGIGDKVILDELSLTICNGGMYILVGPNGTGKSILGYAITGHPQYNICQGNIVFDGDDITSEPTDVCAKKGVSLSSQSPGEVPGIALDNFLRVSREAVTGEASHILKLRKEVRSLMDLLEVSQDYAARYLNIGFPGDEKKGSEILQMLMPNPKLAILDETDSGPGVGAVKVVSKGIRRFRNDKNSLLITMHNVKTLDGLKVGCVHTLVSGTIAHTGGSSLIQGINEEGSQFFGAGDARS